MPAYAQGIERGQLAGHLVLQRGKFEAYRQGRLGAPTGVGQSLFFGARQCPLWGGSGTRALSSPTP